MTDVVFGLSPSVQGKILPYRYIIWAYLRLLRTILTNASFRYTSLDCAIFSSAVMDSVYLSFARSANIKCYDPVRKGQTSFVSASLGTASLYEADFRFTAFDVSNVLLGMQSECTPI